MERINKLRERIDWLDTQIASLLNERMRAADQMGRIKNEMQKEIVDPSREENVINNVEKVIQHPVLKANISNIYREIMAESKVAQQFFQHLSQPFRRIGIIGTGLMGGSICKGLKTKDPSIEIATCAQMHEEDHSLAKAGGWIDKVYSTMGELIQNSELLILASPISTIIQLAEDILKSVTREKLIVIDIASVKSEIVETFERLTDQKIEYISTHPMAGKETRGFINSQATLFVNRPWVIVPHKKNSPAGIESIKAFIKFLGSKPTCLEAKVHDQQTALISHLPAILSKSYREFVRSVDPASQMIAGPGFQSFTRLAHGNSEMHKEICKFNKKAIKNYLEKWLEHLKKL